MLRSTMHPIGGCDLRDAKDVLVRVREPLHVAPEQAVWSHRLHLLLFCRRQRSLDPGLGFRRQGWGIRGEDCWFEGLGFRA